MDKTNFCKTEGCLSRCTLVDPKEQYKCKFFIKASKSAEDPNRCRAYRPEYGDHCDNPNAQADAVNSVIKEEEIKEQS